MGFPGKYQTALRWPVIAGVSAVLVLVVYLVAVQTVDGQLVENAALRGAGEAGRRNIVQATDALDRITVYSLAAAVLLVAGAALLRRRWDLAVAGVGVIVGGQVIVQGLQRVLPRPELVPVSKADLGNSFPSGHTAVAMTVLFATLIVVPYRWRGVALLIVMTWAVGIGHYTLTAKWHRLSDTLAADAIALGLAALASWWLDRRGALHRYTGPPRVLAVVCTVAVAAVGCTSIGLGSVLWAVPLSREGVRAAVHQDAWLIYLGATSFATAGSILAALVFLWSWRRIETDGGPAEHEAAHRRVEEQRLA